jgi:8-amino-7-oxononanoate synthase
MSLEKNYKKFLDGNLYPRHLKVFNANLINFSSNDYLGLAKHPLLIKRSQEYASKWGVGCGSSRLVTGNLAIYEECEKRIAAGVGKPAALILGAGYQTNISVLAALLDPAVLGGEALVFCDRYAHVSMLASTRHVARIVRFRHNDAAHLQLLLEKYADNTAPKFILIESIYSMDGDAAPLAEIIVLARQHNAMLYVDDAHAVGVYGVGGWGKASEHARDIDVVMGTFSKGLGSFGGYIVCSELLRDYLINKCRGLIYSTGLSPAVLGAIDAALELVPQLTSEREALLRKAARVREFFRGQGFECGIAETHIVPWIIGDARETLRVSDALEKKGILAVTIRPPSVPVGKSRIRFCLSAAHSDEDIDKLLEAIKEVVPPVSC